MNKILFAARKAKGLTEEETADALQMNEQQYRELECSLSKVSFDEAKRFGAFYTIPVDYFMLPCVLDIQEWLQVLEDEKSLLATPPLEQQQPGTLAAVARMWLELLIAKEHIRLQLMEMLELQRENKALRELYNSVQENSNK